MTRPAMLAVIGAAGSQAITLIRILSGVMSLEGSLAIDRAWPDAVKAEVAGLGMSVLTIDILEQRAALIEALSSARLVANLAGPYFLLAEACLSAAVEAGCEFLDICDDADVTDRLLTHAPAAEGSGVTALIGMGSSPGTTNILIRAALDAMGGGEGASVNLAWAARGRDLRPGSHAHLLHSFLTARPGQRRTPHWEELAAETIAFPEPVGRTHVCLLGHPEPVTIPKFTGAATVNKGSITPDECLHFLWAQARALDALEGPDRATALPRLWAAFEELASHLPAEGPGVGSGLLIDVEKDGRGYRFSSGSSMEMERATATPAAAGVLLMLQEHGLPPGVWPPEMLRPSAFFDQLAKVSGGGGGLRLDRLEKGQAVERMRIRDLLAAR